MPEQAEVTAAQIARLAGVGRAAVSNWRRRHLDFPAPVGGSDTSPTFSLAAVEQWLRAEGKLGEIAPGERLWRGVDAEGGGKPDGTAAALVRKAAEIGGSAGGAAVFEELVGRYLDSYSRARDTGSATRALAELMATLTIPDDATACVAYDPACGAGTLLLAAATAGVGSLVGQTSDDVLAPLAAARLTVAEGGYTVDIRPGDALLNDPHPDLEADSVVCQPPSGPRDWGYDELAYDPRWEFGMPPRAEAELAWVQHALARLRPGGTAVVLLPPAVAARRPGRRVRAELLRRGALRAVIGLPAGSAAPYGLSLHLWVLRRPDFTTAAPSRVLFIDAGDADRRDADRVPSPQTAERITATWRAFDQDPESFPDQPGLAVALPLIDLLDDTVDLSPARHVPRPDTGLDHARLLEERAMVRSVISRLTEVLPELGAEAAPGPALPLTTVGEMARIGALSIATDGEITVGDIVVPVLGGAAGQARVVAAGDPAVGTLPGRGTAVVRTDPRALDPWFVAGFLRSDTVARQAASHASTSSRMDIRKAPLPRLPLDRQRAYGEAFRGIAEFGDVLRRVADAGERLAQGITDALAEGTLAP